MMKFHKALLIVLLLLALLVWFTIEVSSILLPFVLAFVLAYFLHPCVVKLEKWHFPRAVATGIVTALFCLFVVGTFLILIPILQTQVVALMVKLPALTNIVWEYAQHAVSYTKEKVSQEQLSQIAGAISQTIFSVANGLSARLLKMLTGGIVFFNIISLVSITPVVLFYVLRDWKGVEVKVSALIPQKNEKQVKSIWQEINTILSGFIRGQATVCICLALFYGVALSLIGLDFGLLVGLLSGILSFIPYFGFLTGVVLSVLLALVQHASMNLWIGIALVFLIGQILEGYVLTPKLVGDKVGLHPVWVIFALLAGGALFGFIGVLIAVPVSAVIGVFVRHIVLWYQKTPVYLKETVSKVTEKKKSIKE